MSLIVPFVSHSPGRSRLSTCSRSSHFDCLYLVKAIALHSWRLLMSLAFLTLCLLCVRSVFADPSGYPGGGYPGSGGGWVPSDASGTPLSNNDYGYDPNSGGANLLPSGQQPTISNTYKIPDSADQWWFGAYSPNKYSVNNGDDHYGYGGLYVSNTAGNSTRDNYGTLATFYDPANYGWTGPTTSPCHPTSSAASTPTTPTP